MDVKKDGLDEALISSQKTWQPFLALTFTGWNRMDGWPCGINDMEWSCTESYFIA